MTRRQADKLIKSGAEALVRLTNDPAQEEEFVIRLASRQGDAIITANLTVFDRRVVKFLGLWKPQR